MAQNEEKYLKDLYTVMYKAMIAKNTTILGEMMADDSALIHMTGIRQPRQEYLRAISIILGISRSAIQKQVDTLAKKGYIARPEGKKRGWIVKVKQ